ncbi:MAG: MoaD/ThiS family protein [Fimbriimonadaceae bacterium]
MTIHVKITYFAALKQQACKSNEELEIAPMCVRELYNQLATRYDFNIAPRFILYSINSEFVDESTVLNEDDHVVFIPPVSGG